MEKILLEKLQGFRQSQIDLLLNHSNEGFDFTKGDLSTGGLMGFNGV